jgi:hypothetical protein
MTTRKKIVLAFFVLVGLSGAAYAAYVVGPRGPAGHYGPYQVGSSTSASFDIPVYTWDGGGITEGDSLLVEGPPTLTGGGTTWSVHVGSGNTFLEGQLEVVPNSPTSGVPSFNVTAGAGTYWLGDSGAAGGLSATSSTSGFFYIPETPGGAPTGTPAGLGFRGGATATVYDPMGNVLYVWNTSTHSWKAH